MNREELVAFLLEAKRGTYAASGTGGSVPAQMPGSKQLEYTRGPFFYRDVYYGSAFFAGEEVVYYEGKPVWTMVYAGGMVAPGDAGAVYGFLQEAMQHIGEDRPYRGPSEWVRGPWFYTDASQGTFDRFEGEETIWMDGTCLYRLRYAGGMIA